MHCTRKVTNNIYWVGGNDRRLALFENLFPIPRGVSYNSYVIVDEKTAVMDTVDSSITRQFLENVEHVLAGRTLDYPVSYTHLLWEKEIMHLQKRHLGTVLWYRSAFQ